MLEMKKDWRAQESTCELGDISIETSRAEKQREEKGKEREQGRKEQNIQKLWDNYKSIT